MEFPADQIAIADARCPSCGEVSHQGDGACVSCGYNFQFAAQLLPYEAPELRKFIDRDGHLTRNDIRLGQRALEKLRARFPQITVCTCLASVPDEISISEFGFWLFNQSVPRGPRLVERRLHSILLCIDPHRGEAGLTVGYGLDPFIDESSLTDCLKKIQRPIERGNYGKALSRLSCALIPVLARGFSRASESYAAYRAEAVRNRNRERHAQAAPARRAPARRHPQTSHDTHA